MVLFSAFVFTEIQNSDSFRGNQDNPQKSLKKHSNKSFLISMCSTECHPMQEEEAGV